MSTTLQLTDADLKMIMTDLADDDEGVRRREDQASGGAARTADQRAQRAPVAGGRCEIWRRVESDVQYQAGASVTFHNGLWYARADSRGMRPGTSHDLAARVAAHEARDRVMAFDDVTRRRRANWVKGPINARSSPADLERYIATNCGSLDRLLRMQLRGRILQLQKPTARSRGAPRTRGRAPQEPRIRADVEAMHARLLGVQ